MMTATTTTASVPRTIESGPKTCPSLIWAIAIPKAANPEHAAENAGAGDLVLSEREITRIDEGFPLGRPPRELPTL